MADVRLDGYEIPEKGPDEETLTTDIAWVAPLATHDLRKQDSVSSESVP